MSDFLYRLGAIASLAGLPASAQQGAPSMAGRSTVYAPNGVIATSQPLATAAGLAVLQRGGNAIDAAVTAAAVLNLVEPHMAGMGGVVFGDAKHVIGELVKQLSGGMH